MKKILVPLLVSVFFVGCSGVSVKTHHGFMGPDVYEATDGTTSVYYYNGDCCCVAKDVLKILADRANRKDLDWNLMKNQIIRDSVLTKTCDSLLSKIPTQPQSGPH